MKESFLNKIYNFIIINNEKSKLSIINKKYIFNIYFHFITLIFITKYFSVFEYINIINIIKIYNFDY